MKNKLKVVYNCDRLPQRYLYRVTCVPPLYTGLRDGLYIVRGNTKGEDHKNYYVRDKVWYLIDPLTEEEKAIINSVVIASEHPLSEDEKDQFFKQIVRQLRKK